VDDFIKAIVPIMQVIGGAPLHVLLLIAIYVLWTRVQTLESKLEDCLAANRAKSSP